MLKTRLLSAGLMALALAHVAPEPALAAMFYPPSVAAAAPAGSNVTTAAVAPTSALTGCSNVGDRWIDTEFTPPATYTCATNNGTATTWRLTSPVKQVFTGSGQWTRPAWATQHHIEMVNPGGGGASGAIQTSTSVAAFGGNGGNGGAYLSIFLNDSDLGSVANGAVTLGAPGTGGAAPTSGTTAGGNPGTAGGLSTIVINGVTYRPYNAAAGGNAPTATATGAAQSTGIVGPGIAYSAGAQASGGASTTMKGGMGAAGGGTVSAANVEGAGGSSVVQGEIAYNGVNGGAVGNGGNAGAGADGLIAVLNTPVSGRPATGGGSAISGNGGKGGNGVGYGNGGAGGGGSRILSGAGGDGGPSIAVIASY